VRTTWENKVEYESEKEYNSSLNTFIDRCAQCPEFIQYVESTALCPIKEKFVRVLTDQVMYLGNTTTNRIESSLARLKKKKCLMNSSSDISKNWKQMDNMLANMFIELQKDFQQSIIHRDDTLTGMVLWSKLQLNISKEAVQYLVDEGVVGTDKTKCRCLLMSTMGLLCACSLAKTIKEGKPISLDDIHNHWMMLKFDAAHLCKNEDADLSLLPELEVLQVYKLIFLLILVLYIVMIVDVCLVYLWISLCIYGLS
jgi:hypothetical protein